MAPHSSTKGNTVDNYLKDLPKDQRNALQQIRQIILSVAPQVEEVISYQIPTYKLNGPLVHLMAKKDHLSFITVNKSIVSTFKKELAHFKVSGTTVHFSAEHLLPDSLIKKIVKERIKQNKAIAD